MTRDDVRAVLVTGAEVSDAWAMPADQLMDAIERRFDAAADQQSIRWCVEHGRVESRYYDGRCTAWVQVCECRIVDALVVPLPEASE
jgi:hypothetical protein